MKTWVRYKVVMHMGFGELLAQMHPDRIIGLRKDIGEFTRPLDDPETCWRFEATPKKQEFFISWFELSFEFTPEEMAQASLFHLRFHRSFVEYVQEERTLYDDSEECPFCGEGRRQLGPLVLPKLAKRLVPLLLTGAGHHLCTKAAAESLMRLTGGHVRFLPVFRSNKDMAASLSDPTATEPSSDIEPWVDDERVAALQLCVDPSVRLSVQTRHGVDPYNDREEPYACPLGHIQWYRQLGPLVVAETPTGRWPIASSTKTVGGMSGLFRPSRELLVTRQIGEDLLRQKVKYLEIDPVYSEDGGIL